MVQGWVAYPKSNYGVVFIGEDESFAHNNKYCVSFYGDVYLEVKILEKK
jgi:hypothetical protein